jgi:hypothetical protein
MHRFFYAIIFISLISTSIHAQIIGDDALRKIEDGNVTTLEGEFIVYLSDTVSPDFVTQQLESLGYQLGFTDIQPFTIAIINQPDEETVNEISTKPEVLEVSLKPDPVDSTYFKDLLASQGLTESEYEAALSRIIASQTIERLYLQFQYSMNERAVINFMTNYRSVAYEIISDFPRTVNILVEPGTERDVMLNVEKLPFVEYTALIGVIGE